MSQISVMVMPAGRFVRWGGCWALMSILALTISGCGSTSDQVERWHMTETRRPTPVEKVPGAARQPVRVVFFREAGKGERAQIPINLYINGQYQASLVGNTYTEQSLCPGEHGLAVHFRDVELRYMSKRESRQVAIDAEPVQYFRVSESATGAAQVSAVAGDKAAVVAPTLQLLQTHTISRVVRNGCATS